jgi:hypothetical protein
MDDTVALTCHLGAQEAQKSILTSHNFLILLYGPQNKHFPQQSDTHLFSSAQNYDFLLFHDHIYFSVTKTEEFGAKIQK